MLQDNKPKIQHATRFAALACEESDADEFPDFIAAAKMASTGTKMPRWIEKGSQKDKKAKSNEAPLTSLDPKHPPLQVINCGPCWAFQFPTEEKVFKSWSSNRANAEYACCRIDTIVELPSYQNIIQNQKIEGSVDDVSDVPRHGADKRSTKRKICSEAYMAACNCNVAEHNHSLTGELPNAPASAKPGILNVDDQKPKRGTIDKF